MPSRRQSSLTATSRRNPSSTIRTFSSGVYFRLATNVVMLGALFDTEQLPIKIDTIKETIRERFPAKLAPVNIKAFDLGYEACRQAVK